MSRADAKGAALGTEVMVERVVKRTPDGKTVLGGVSFEVLPGSHAALIGPNGSGKTTLLMLLAGVDLPDEGAILLDGLSLACFDYFDLRDHRIMTGYVFEDQGLLTNLSILENVALPLRYHHGSELDDSEIRLRVLALLTELEIDFAASLTPARTNISVRKRALLARALLLNPRLLLIDEPQGGLVTGEQELVRRACENRRKARGMTIIHTDHDGNFGALVPGRVIRFDQGLISAIGAPGEVKV